MSRLFRQVAEIFLYRNSTFRHPGKVYDYDALLSFCRTITESPHLASLVHITFIQILVGMSPEALSLIGRSLQAMIKLQELTVLGTSSDTHYGISIPCRRDVWILHRCTFQLQRLRRSWNSHRICLISLPVSLASEI